MAHVKASRFDWFTVVSGEIVQENEQLVRKKTTHHQWILIVICWKKYVRRFV